MTEQEKLRAETEKLWDRYNQLIIDKKYNNKQGKNMGIVCFTTAAHEYYGTTQECLKKLIEIVEDSKTEQEYIKTTLAVLLGE